MMVQGICMLQVGPGVLACGSWCVIILVLCWYVDPGMLASWFRGIVMLACWSFCVDIWVLMHWHSGPGVLATSTTNNLNIFYSWDSCCFLCS